MSARNPETVTRSTNHRAALIGAVAASFLVRIAVVLVLKMYEFPALSADPDGTHAHWEFGYEMGRVARSIAMGHGFGSPFHGWTGPTAWQPPVYPYLLAGIFRVFGVYSPTSGMVALAFNCVAAAATCVFIYKIAERIAGSRFALWAAWAWALLPNVMEYDVKWAWETSLSTLLLTIALWWAIDLPRQQGTRPWLRVGAWWGLIALTNTVLLVLMPFSLAWAAYYSSGRPANFTREARSHGENGFKMPAHRRAHMVGLRFLAAFAIMFAITVPWNIRDRIVMGKWMFVRDNFWAEMNYGNGEAAHGNAAMSWKHPGTQPTELRKYEAEGEVRYIDAKRAEVMAFLRRNPRHFARLVGVRTLLFWSNIFKDTSDDLQPDVVLYTHGHIILFSALAWVGLVLMLRHPKERGVTGATPVLQPRYGWLLASVMLFYPLIYYVTSVDGRYRHPIEPVMLILAVYAVAQTRLQAPGSGLRQPGA